MADYSLGGGFNSGYGDGGMGLGGGYGSNSGYGSSSGLGLGGGNGNNYSNGWGGGYSLADGYTGSSGLGLSGGNNSGGFFGFNFDNFLSNSPDYSTSSYNQPSFSLADTPAVDSSLGLQAPSAATSSWDGAIGLQAPKSVNQSSPVSNDFGDSDFGRALKKAGLWAAKQNPNTNTALGVASAAQALGAGEYGQGLGTLASIATKNPLLGGGLGLAVDAAQGKPIAERGATTFGGLLGGAVGSLVGPFGSVLGSEFGSRMGGAIARGETTPSGPTPSQRMGNEGGGIERYLASPEVQRALDAAERAGNTQAKGDPVGALLGGLMGLYGVNKMKNSAEGQRRFIEQQEAQSAAQLQALRDQINAMQESAPAAPEVVSPDFAGVASRLEAMFGPQSGVASELRNQLSRKDAAAGRRSQYGPREVQLLAELTRLRAQAEPSYMNAEVAAANAANQGAFNLYNSDMQNRNNQLRAQMSLQQMQGSNATNALANQYKAQQDADTRRQQTLATLYGMGKESGAFDWLGNQASSWWNGE